MVQNYVSQVVHWIIVQIVDLKLRLTVEHEYLQGADRYVPSEGGPLPLKEQ